MSRNLPSTQLPPSNPPSPPPSFISPIFGCALAAVSIVTFAELHPYHDAATNALAVAAQWQLLATYVGVGRGGGAGGLDGRRPRSLLP